MTVEVSPPSADTGDQGLDGELRLQFARPLGQHRFLVLTKRSHLSYPLVDGLLGRLREFKKPWVLFAPYVALPWDAISPSITPAS